MSGGRYLLLVFHWASGLACLFALAACAPRYPLDIPEAQWQGMTTEQRLHAQEKQAELDSAAERRRAAEARAREAEAARKQAELDTRRREARYGERVQCVLSEAEAHLGGRWRSVEPVALDLVRGVELAFDLAERGGDGLRYRTTAHADFDGQTLRICREAGADHRDGQGCARLLGTFNDYRRGLDQGVEAARFLRGRMRCDLVPGPGMPRYR